MNDSLSKKISWIEPDKLQRLKIVRSGVIGGCIRQPFIVTSDSKVYFIHCR